MSMILCSQIHLNQVSEELSSEKNDKNKYCCMFVNSKYKNEREAGKNEYKKQNNSIRKSVVKCRGQKIKSVNVP